MIWKILLTIKCTGTRRDRCDENSNNYTSFSKNTTLSSLPTYKCDLKTNHRCYTLYTSTQCYNSISSFKVTITTKLGKVRTSTGNEISY